MNTNTGDMSRYADLSYEDKISGVWQPVPDEEAPKVRKMNKLRRKNWMRNKPCPCGSENKFKKCCWAKAGLIYGGAR